MALMIYFNNFTCFFKIYIFIICKYTVAVFRHQKGELAHFMNHCEPLCVCWDLNLWPLEEQLVLLPPELSLQPPKFTCLSLSFLYSVRFGENQDGPWETGG